MKQKNNIGKLLLSLLLIITLTGLVSAQQPAGLIVPHQFYGDVSANGQSAPSNLIIEARINGVVVGSTITNNGRYGYDPIFYVEYQGSSTPTITFFIEGVQAGTATFNSGHSTRLDLSATGVDLPSSGSGTASGGAGGTGSAGGAGSSTGGVSTSSEEDDENASGEITITTSDTCEPVWVCSEWTECVNNQQRRVCVDRNQCDLEETRPEERRSCGLTNEEILTGVQPDDEPSQGFISRFTGFVTGAGDGAYSIIPLVAIIAVIAGLFLFLFYRRKK
jgi:hypothetical protein